VRAEQLNNTTDRGFSHTESESFQRETTWLSIEHVPLLSHLPNENPMFNGHLQSACQSLFLNMKLSFPSSQRLVTLCKCLTMYFFKFRNFGIFTRTYVSLIERTLKSEACVQPSYTQSGYNDKSALRTIRVPTDSPNICKQA